MLDPGTKYGIQWNCAYFPCIVFKRILNCLESFQPSQFYIPRPFSANVIMTYYYGNSVTSTFLNLKEICSCMRSCSATLAILLNSCLSTANYYLLIIKHMWPSFLKRFYGFSTFVWLFCSVKSFKRKIFDSEVERTIFLDNILFIEIFYSLRLSDQYFVFMYLGKDWVLWL